MSTAEFFETLAMEIALFGLFLWWIAGRNPAPQAEVTPVLKLRRP